MLVAAAGNEGIDLNHPIHDEISPDFPPGAAVTRPVNNNCVVLPTEIPGVVVVTATGAENLLAWYSTYGNITDVTAPGGSRFQTPTLDPARGRVLAPYSSTAGDLDVEAALGRLVVDASGNFYAWLNGTSMAAPHAAGVAALIRSAFPEHATGSVVAMLRNTATGMPCPAAARSGCRVLRRSGAVLLGGHRQQQLLRSGARERTGSQPVITQPSPAGPLRPGFIGAGPRRVRVSWHAERPIALTLTARRGRG